MKNNRIRERVTELESITIPRIKKKTKDIIQDIIFEGSYQSVIFYDEFMKLIDMHKRKRLNSPRFYELLTGLVDEMKSFLDQSKR